jgi:hypothetical protein
MDAEKLAVNYFAAWEWDTTARYRRVPALTFAMASLMLSKANTSFCKGSVSVGVPPLTRSRKD